PPPVTGAVRVHGHRAGRRRRAVPSAGPAGGPAGRPAGELPRRADRAAQAVRVPEGERGQGALPEGEGDTGRRGERPEGGRPGHRECFEFGSGLVVGK
ncbi:hypothetical protein THAOC_24376, partial [Thalassiosira oceanica]